MKQYSERTIGVLALQGDFEKHVEQVQRLGATTRLVKLARDLKGLHALIWPGGESTTMSILLDKHGLRGPLIEFARVTPVYGTCAGMIMLASGILDNQSGVKPLGLIDIDVLRNGYGRQVFSFEKELELELADSAERIAATFIRAPRVVRTGPGVRVLAQFSGDPILVRHGQLLAASFHAELGSNTAVLRYFLDHFLGDKPKP